MNDDSDTPTLSEDQRVISEYFASPAYQQSKGRRVARRDRQWVLDRFVTLDHELVPTKSLLLGAVRAQHNFLAAWICDSIAGRRTGNLSWPKSWRRPVGRHSDPCDPARDRLFDCHIGAGNTFDDGVNRNRGHCIRTDVHQNGIVLKVLLFFCGVGILSSLTVITLLIAFLRQGHRNYVAAIAALLLSYLTSFVATGFFEANDLGWQIDNYNFALIAQVSVIGVVLTGGVTWAGVWWLRSCGWLCIRREDEKQRE